MLQESRVVNDRPANDSEPMNDLPEEGADVGSVLRRTRLQSGRKLEQVSRALNIRLQHLAAIEESRFERLPGRAYAIGFVRSYAAYLGLDEAMTVARFKEENQAQSERPRLLFPEPIDEARVPKGTLVAVSFAVALGIYGAWHLVSTRSEVSMIAVQDVPDRLVAEANLPLGADSHALSGEAMTDVGPANDSAAAPSKAPRALAETAAPAVERAREESSSTPVVAAAVPQEASRPAARETVTDLGEQTLAEPGASAIAGLGGALAGAPQSGIAGLPVAVDESARVVLRALADTWVQVRTADQSILVSRLLRAGETYRAPNRQDLVMMTGNAGGLEITVDGKLIGSLGPQGAVMRDVKLGADQLLAASPHSVN